MSTPNTAPILITYDRAVELLDAAVAARGADYVYPATVIERFDDEYGPWEAKVCDYVRDGAPSCIVGHVFHALGVPLEALATCDAADRGSVGASNLPAALGYRAGVDVAYDDGRVETLLRETQNNQDGGMPWGDAVADAKAYVATGYDA